MPYIEDSVPFAGTSETSRSAAESVRPRTKLADESKILAYLEQQGRYGSTCDEVEVVLGLAHQTASARLKGLQDRHLVVVTNNVRKTRRGRIASVYVSAHLAAEVQALE